LSATSKFSTGTVQLATAAYVLIMSAHLTLS